MSSQEVEETAPVKRKHKTLSLQDKYTILKKLNSGVSGKQLAKKYGVGRSTITDIKNQRQRIKSFLEKGYSPNRKTLKYPDFPKMEEHLYSWILSQKMEQAALTYEIVAEKAKQLYEKYYGNGQFHANRGWIRKFKQRYGLKIVKITGLKLSSRLHLVDPFKEHLKEKIKTLQLLPNQLYFADESLLFWKLLPDQEKAHKERLTFLVCSNSDGSHKLNILVVGKSTNPRVFKNQIVPVDYKSNSKAQMNSHLFAEWFQNSFVKQVKDFSLKHNLPPKALLLIDNVHGQELSSDDGVVTMVTLPQSCLALIRRFNQNSIRLMKLLYRKTLLRHVLLSKEDETTTPSKTVNLRDAVCFLHEAWREISANTLEKCCAQVLEGVWDRGNDQQENDSGALDRITPSVDINREMVLNKCEEKEVKIKEEYEIKAESFASKSINHSDAVGYFNLCLEWALQNNVEPNDIVVLQHLKEKALVISQSSNFDQS